MTIVLASKSPRRRELLTQLGVDFISIDANIDEQPLAAESAEALVQRLALQKARQGLTLTAKSDSIVIGSDTVVVIGQQILGKPRDQQDALAMLRSLSGNIHQVMTAVAVVNKQSEQLRLSINQVSFRVLTESEILTYWQTGEPVDKAGAYAIQGLAAQFIQHLDGSYSAVMGLPLFETAELLTLTGVRLLNNNDKKQL